MNSEQDVLIQYKTQIANTLKLKDGICWICRENEGSTGEHVIPRQAIDSFFDYSNNPRNLFLNSESVKNKIVQSPKSRNLHSNQKICEFCNGALTNSSDKYFRRLTDYLRGEHGGNLKIKFHKVYRKDQFEGVFQLHMYLQKFMGFRILEMESEFFPVGVSDNLLQGSVCPFLFFGFYKTNLKGTLGFGPPAKTKVWFSDLGDAYQDIPLYTCHINIDTWTLEVHVCPFNPGGNKVFPEMYSPLAPLKYLRAKEYFFRGY